MEGNEFVWIASIILGTITLSWLVMAWLESAYQADNYEVDTHSLTATALGRSEQQSLDALEMEIEMMLRYPLDPFTSSLLWRHSSPEEWVSTPSPSDGRSTALPTTAAERPVVG